MDIADSVLDLIGDTPLVRLSHVGAGLRAPVVAKLETTNPGGNVKDRAALGMLEAAERDGLIGPGSTIVEKTSRAADEQTLCAGHAVRHGGVGFARRGSHGGRPIARSR